MRVLILTCNTGEGHNSCAGAIKEICDAEGDVCEITDSLRFLSQGFSRFISWGHATMYRYFPGLFRMGYAYSERHPGVFHENSGIYRLLTGGTQRLRDYLTAGRYDTVICVHVFSALLVTAMQKSMPLPLKTAFVVTDYTCSPIVQDSRLDRYFIPDEALAGDFLCPNIPPEKMVACGIPIRQIFYEHGDRRDAKARFGIRQEHAHLVMMCGSMGCGPMERLAGILCGGIGPDCELTIVCGTNQRLRRRLEKKYASVPNLHILGFVRDMGTLMDSADLYLTKPGGLSVTEAFAKGLPMVYIDAVAGCEEYNRRYFVRMGGAETGDTPQEVAAICLRLLRDGTARERMAQALAQAPKQNAAREIRDTMALLQVEAARV